MRLILLLIIGTMPLMAAFSQPVQVVQLAYGQQEAVLTFQADSNIRKAKPLCDCTKLSYHDNTLTARVNTSEFAQSVDKQIDATTADGVTTRLTMRFEVPQALQLSSRSMIWQQGGPSTEQKLAIRIPAGSPVHKVREAAISGDDFDYTPHTVKEGVEYSVSVTPRSTGKKALNRLIIKTDSADPRYAQYIIYLSIQSP